MKVKEESAQTGLTLNVQKAKIMASNPIASQQIDEGEMETLTDFILSGSKITTKSLWMVTATMKLKDACFLEEKLCPNWTAY